jgi:hypothetical protein
MDRDRGWRYPQTLSPNLPIAKDGTPYGYEKIH